MAIRNQPPAIQISQPAWTTAVMAVLVYAVVRYCDPNQLHLLILSVGAGVGMVALVPGLRNLLPGP